MDKAKLVSTLETLGLLLLTTSLTWLSTHAADIDPGNGTYIGEIALATVNLLNSWLGTTSPITGTTTTPTERIVSLALRK